MAIEGPLRELAISDVFQLLDLSRKTGVLTIRNETRDRPAVVRFERGAVVGAEFPENSRRLGHLLLRAGKVTEGEIEMARRHQEGLPGTPLGGVLIELGLVSETELRRQLRFQVEETIYELIRWKDGYFRFEETLPLDNGTISIRVPTESLLMEAARRIDEWTTLESKVAHMGVVPALVAGGGDDGPTLDLHPSEWEVLAEIDGERTLKAIATELGRGEFEVAKILYGLISTGVVEIVDERPLQVTTTASPASALKDSLAEVERMIREQQYGAARQMTEDLVRRHPQNPDAHLLAGRALAGLGRWAEAAEALAQTVRQDPLSSAGHYHLAFASARLGDLRRAEEAWSTYLRLPDTTTRRRETAMKAARAVSTLRRVLDEEGE